MTPTLFTRRISRQFVPYRSRRLNDEHGLIRHLTTYRIRVGASVHVSQVRRGNPFMIRRYLNHVLRLRMHISGVVVSINQFPLHLRSFFVRKHYLTRLFLLMYFIDFHFYNDYRNGLGVPGRTCRWWEWFLRV